MYQRVTLLGRIGNITAGDKATRISVATSESWKKDDEWQTKTSWHNCICFGASKTYFDAKEFAVGDMVLVEGKLDYYKKEETYYTSIIINSIKRVSKNAKIDDSTTVPNPDDDMAKSADTNNTTQPETVEDDDLPF